MTDKETRLAETLPFGQGIYSLIDRQREVIKILDRMNYSDPECKCVELSDSEDEDTRKCDLCILREALGHEGLPTRAEADELAEQLIDPWTYTTQEWEPTDLSEEELQELEALKDNYNGIDAHVYTARIFAAQTWSGQNYNDQEILKMWREQ